MKIAVSADGYSLYSNPSPILGKSNAFIIIDLEDNEIKNIKSLENPAKKWTGSGNTAANFIANHDVEILISGKFGNVAFQILKNADIKTYKFTSGTVEKNVKQFIKGKLKEITSVDSGFPE
ncbi:MAG: NifB/NifX family molybdenum-iron cluster-binding protein [Methanobacterium sp.]